MVTKKVSYALTTLENSIHLNIRKKKWWG